MAPMVIDAAARDSWRDLYERIWSMLDEHRLEPTPTNFGLGHRYFSGDDGEFRGLVDQAIERSGGLTAVSAAALIAQRSVELSAGDLQVLADDAQRRLAAVAELVGGAGRDTRDYGDALETNAEQLAGGRAVVEVTEDLMQLTRSMIARTRDVEEQLRSTADEMGALRSSLAEAQEAANRDALTGLPNRRALDARLATATEAARRTGQPFTIAICDIDHFKAFNDTFGHQIGDEVIKFVAASLAKDGGVNLFAARYGGEEFVVLFEGIAADAAGAQIDRIRQAISTREMKITATGQSLGRLSFSAGVASLRPGEGSSAVLKRADTALYAAKRGGRNRVEIG